MKLEAITKTDKLSVYQLEKYQEVKRIVASSAETRAICNDPFVTGIRYTRTLQAACAEILSALQQAGLSDLKEQHASVLHVLRGGLNFGLREALSDAFGWNDHASHFISAQRARKCADSADWIITEDSYSKLVLKEKNQIVFGDVLATGTSLENALHRITEHAIENKSQISNVIFFTIGGPRSHLILAELDKRWRELFPDYTGSLVVYLEGIFSVAQKKSSLSIAIDGTDLLRLDSVLAPEFIESQYENASYPLERCAIYDAGSRAFDFQHYLADIRDYWQQVLTLAESGMTFNQLLKERMPELDAARFGRQDLKLICLQQLEKLA